MKELLQKLEKYVNSLNESSIDFPSKDLPLDIWDKTDDGYILKPDLKETILEALAEYPDLDLLDIAETIHIVGSIGTNLYDKDADIDVHIAPKANSLGETDSEILELMQRDVMNWFKNNRDEKGWYINEHPLEVYLQLNPTQDYFSDTVYDLLQDLWIKPYKKYDLDYNPYAIYGDTFSELQKIAAPADVTLGELRRDVIDYNRLMEAIKKSSKEVRQKLQHSLELKLEELEEDIEQLVQNKEIWRSVRHNNSIQTADVIDDISRLTQSDDWKKGNAIFKFMDRYLYMQLVNDLKKLIEDKELTDEDVPKIEDILKEFNDIN